MSRDWKATSLYQEFDREDSDGRVERFIEAAAGLTVDFLKSQDSFWLWDGHRHVAELTSGKLSNLFINCTPIYTRPDIQRDIAHALCEKMARSPYVGFEPFLGESGLFKTHTNKWVVGAAMGGIGLAQSIASVMGQGWRSAFVEKHPNVGMELKRFDLGEEPLVLLCEDVVTTGGTTMKMVDAVYEKHPDVRFVPASLTVINRDPGNRGFQNQNRVTMGFLNLVEKSAETWDSVDDLPERMKGCVPIRPKENWRALFDEKL